MKKMKNTRYARIDTTYTTAMDAKINRVENAVLDQQARLDEMIQRLKNMLEDEPKS